VVAIVDGQRIELWPESGQRLPKVGGGNAAPPPFNAEREVRAPIPGVILSVAVQPGASVTPGQELYVLEAMKMRNPISAGRAGIIQAVHVSPGAHVQHRQVLMEFAVDAASA
ncbi:MAG: acetyl-CoA carboxylase biotin carboxyl carrier protein subunit, partial [Chloroflexi bacterium]|nr:acetyl-CoA carboxylase biotin carboxyl carrier protein subunit [Chloroflexota bacterium]